MRNKDLYAEHELQDWSWRGIAERSLTRTFHMLAVEPILFLITIYISLVYGVLYACTSPPPSVFSSPPLPSFPPAHSLTH